MSHAELRESFTAASASQCLGLPSAADASNRPPVMGASPHAQHRHAGVLGTSPETLAAEAAAIRESAEAKLRDTQRIEQIARSATSTGQESFPDGSESGPQLGSTPVMGHAGLRESFSGGAAAAAAAASAIHGLSSGSPGAAPPPLSSVFSPHGERREMAAAAGTPTAAVSSEFKPSAPAPQLPPALDPSSPFNAVPRSLSGPMGGSSPGNGSFGSHAVMRAVGGTSAPRLGVSPFADPARANFASGGSGVPVPSILSGGPGTHAELRESFSGGAAAAAAAAVLSSAASGSGTDVAEGEGRNGSFANTPHTELRERGAGTLGADLTSLGGRAPADNGSFGGASPPSAMHTALRETVSAGAAAATAAAIAKEKELQKSKNETTALLGVSPVVAATMLTGGMESGAPRMGSSQPTAHAALREGFAGPQGNTPVSPLSQGNNGLLAASVGSASGTGGRPALSAPSRGTAAAMHHQLRSTAAAEFGERAESGGRPYSGALSASLQMQQRMAPFLANSGAVLSPLGGSSAPANSFGLHSGSPGGGVPPAVLAPRVNPHAQRREEATAMGASLGSSQANARPLATTTASTTSATEFAT